MATTIRNGVSDLVNALNKVRNLETDPYKQLEMQKVLKVLFVLWEQVIYDKLDNTTKDYQDAVTALNDGEKAAKDAEADLKKVTKAIKAATKAAKAVDKIINLAIKIIL
jgi:chromosome segregation ATPase